MSIIQNIDSSYLADTKGRLFQSIDLSYLADTKGRLLDYTKEQVKNFNSNIGANFSNNLPNSAFSALPFGDNSNNTLISSSDPRTADTDKTTNALLNNTDNNNIYHYPQELEGLSDKNGPRNIVKIQICNVEGGSLQSLLKQFQDMVKGINVDKINNLTNGTIDWLKDNTSINNALNGINNTVDFIADKAEKAYNFVSKPIDNTSKALGDGEKYVTNKAVQELTDTGRVRLSKPINTIYLYTPDDLNVSYGIQYNEDDLTSTYRLLDLLNAANLASASPEVADILVQLGINVAQSTLNSFTPNFLKFGDKGVDVPALLKAKARLAPLLNKEYLFERVKRRSFQFRFKFYPKTKKEIESVGKIIAAFKYHAHPELGQGRFLKAPSVFTIKHYVHDGKNAIHENLFINRIHTCALEDIKVGYNDVGVSSTLKDQHLFTEYGFKCPVGIRLDLTFKELVLLTREDFTKDSDFFSPQNSSDGKYH